MLVKKDISMEYLEVLVVMLKQCFGMLLEWYLEEKLKGLWPSEVLETRISVKLLWK